MTDSVPNATARARAALRRWHEARRGVNDPASIPGRLEQIVAVTERAIATPDDRLATAVEALVVELSEISFPVGPDDALGALEQATLALNGSLNRIVRVSSRAESRAVDQGSGLPSGVRVPAKDIADQLEAFALAVEDIRPVLEKITKAQDKDVKSSATQAALVQNFIERAEVKIELIGIKTGNIGQIDVSGLIALAQQLAILLRDFATMVSEARGRVSR